MRSTPILVALVAAGLAASPARADDTLTVTVLDGPAGASTVPAPPAVAVPSGACETLFDAAAANDPALACPSWAAPDGDWGPEVAMAGGDTLRFAFAEPVGEVRVAMTTGAPRGLRTPASTCSPNGKDCTPPSMEFRNVNRIEPTVATGTVDGRVWTVAVPNPIPIGTGGQMPLSVIARATPGGPPRSYALTGQLPRWDRPPSTGCATGFYNPGQANYSCYAIPHGGPPPIPASFASLERTARLCGRRLTVRGQTNSGGALRLTVSHGRLRARLRRTVTGAGRLTLRVRLSKRLARRLRARHSARVALSLTPGGNVPAAAQRRVRVRRSC